MKSENGFICESMTTAPSPHVMVCLMYISGSDSVASNQYDVATEFN